MIYIPRRTLQVRFFPELLALRLEELGADLPPEATGPRPRSRLSRKVEEALAKEWERRRSVVVVEQEFRYVGLAIDEPLLEKIRGSLKPRESLTSVAIEAAERMVAESE